MCYPIISGIIVLSKEREVNKMKTYYRFIFSTEEILEFDADMVSFSEAESRARKWAEDSKATFEYLGAFKRDC